MNRSRREQKITINIFQSEKNVHIINMLGHPPRQMFRVNKLLACTRFTSYTMIFVFIQFQTAIFCLLHFKTEAKGTNDNNNRFYSERKIK